MYISSSLPPFIVYLLYRGTVPGAEGTEREHTWSSNLPVTSALRGVLGRKHRTVGCEASVYAQVSWLPSSFVSVWTRLREPSYLKSLF